MTGNRLPAQKTRRGSVPSMDSSQQHRQGQAIQGIGDGCVGVALSKLGWTTPHFFMFILVFV